MEPVTIVLIVLCAIMFGIIIWLVCTKFKSLTSEEKEQLAEKGMQLIRYLKTAWTNDGRIDMAELEQIMRYLIGIIAFLAGKSVYAVQIQTDTYELLQEKTE